MELFHFASVFLDIANFSWVRERKNINRRREPKDLLSFDVIWLTFIYCGSDQCNGLFIFMSYYAVNNFQHLWKISRSFSINWTAAFRNHLQFKKVHCVCPMCVPCAWLPSVLLSFMLGTVCLAMLSPVASRAALHVLLDIAERGTKFWAAID